MMKRLLSREEYEQWVVTLDKDYCSYCDIERQIVLGRSAHWTWVANLAPHWRYNTLLISNAHKLDFDELDVAEFTDLQRFYRRIVDHLLSLNLQHTDGSVMKYFMFMIRSRKYQDVGEGGDRKSRHLHINLCPDGKGSERLRIDPSAVDVDVEAIALPASENAR
jgi:galactose-1-phosphate uridylyltransferase